MEKDDADWLHNSQVKAQMKRMDPSFSEKSLGFKSFSDFLRSRTDVVELDEERKAAMVSNLLVVLCSEQATQQVVNTGSLYS